MKYKKTQLIMVWFLPIILIGGLFIPVLGYLVVAMMAFFLVLSLFKSRFWCWNLCPRGAFLDIILSKISLKRPLPKIFLKAWFRWSVFILFLGFLTYRILSTGGDLILIGSVFVSMCLLTTIISVLLGVSIKHRSWCAICPMGTLQEKIGNIKKKNP
ncbi:MAG: 4Fe-4S binding protein [Candidatus Omnitrophica bacterium]|nr:4Fe-4S binding protein [Candidatus Omnitrophota bacterium]